MNAFPNAPLAWGRTRTVARSLGVDLKGALIDGWLTRRDLDDLVCACTSCATDNPCTAGQAAPAAPCRNLAALGSLHL